jgi:hypothetical protein
MHYIMLELAHIQPFYALDQVHAEPKSEIQVEQVQKEYGGPQMPNTRILTLLLDQDKPRCIAP